VSGVLERGQKNLKKKKRYGCRKKNDGPDLRLGFTSGARKKCKYKNRSRGREKKDMSLEEVGEEKKETISASEGGTESKSGGEDAKRQKDNNDTSRSRRRQEARAGSESTVFSKPTSVEELKNFFRKA